MTVSATATILALIEHELPQHELVTLIDLRRENLEIVEFAIGDGSPVAGRLVRDLQPARPLAPDLGQPRRPRPRSRSATPGCEPGDLVMAILEPGVEDDLKRMLMPA